MDIVLRPAVGPPNIDFGVLPLFDRRHLETIGLCEYMRQLLARRWKGGEAFGMIYAVSNRDSFLADKRWIAPIGNNAFLCTIIIVDPVVPIVLIIVNRESVFLRYCANNMGLHALIAVAHFPDMIVICANHERFTTKGRTHEIHCPKCVDPVINALCKAYNTTIVSSSVPSSASNDRRDYIVRTFGDPCASRINCADLCPLSASSRAYYANYDTSIWGPPRSATCPGSSAVYEYPVRAMSAPITFDDPLRWRECLTDCV